MTTRFLRVRCEIFKGWKSGELLTLANYIDIDITSTMENLQPKLIYLTKRNPGLTRAEFIARWRLHGQLGISLPRWRNIARYVHVDLEQPADACLCADYDGIGMIWHKSPAHRAAHVADRSSRGIMERDEAETFAAPIADCCLIASEIVVHAPDPRARWKLTRFAASNSPALLPPSAEGYARNHPLPPETSKPRGLDVALVEEFWFSTRSAAIVAAPWLAHGALVTLGREVQRYP